VNAPAAGNSRNGALAVASVIGLFLTVVFFFLIGMAECLMGDGSALLRSCRSEKQFELRAFPVLSIALIVAAHFVARKSWWFGFLLALTSAIIGAFLVGWMGRILY
jgi:hypothetical protein